MNARTFTNVLRGIVISMMVLVGLGMISSCTLLVSNARQDIDTETEYDTLTERKVHRALRRELKHRQDERIRVTVSHGIVLLTGQIVSEERRTDATNIALQIPNVRAVQNELTTDNFRNVLQRQKDAYLSTMVRQRLKQDEKIDRSQFKIVIDRSVVYLIGRPTEAAAEAVINHLRSMRGVAAIVKVLEYEEES